MSSTDNRIVQMQFDNAQFEANVKQTMNSLDKLEDSLQLTGASKGMNKIAAESTELCKSMNTVGSAVETVKIQFSALQVAGAVAMTKLTLAAINAGKKINNAIFGQIISGGKARSQNIENAKFQLEGLGMAWNDISGDINYAVKDTAFGLDEAARVASQLVASLDLSAGYNEDMSNNMKKNLRAISGVAAMTNSSYSEIGNIFTTVASNGKLMTMQLRQLSYKGLNVSSQLARYLNWLNKTTEYTEQNVGDLVSKGKISFREFADAMDWCFGEHAKEANKTFSGALSNMKAALSRIGQKFFDPLYESARKVFNAITPAIDSINKSLTPVYDLITELAAVVAGNVTVLFDQTDFIKGLQYLIIALYTYIRPFIAAIQELGILTLDKLPEMSAKFLEFAKSIQLYGERAESVKNIIKGVINIFRLFGHVVLGALDAISPVFGVFGNSIDDTLSSVSKLFNKINDNYDMIVSIIKIISSFVKTKVAKFVSDIVTALKKIDLNRLKELISVIFIVLNSTFTVLRIIAVLAVNLIVFAINNIPRIGNLLNDIVGTLSTIAYGIGGIFSNLFGGGSQSTTLEVETEVGSTSEMDDIVEKSPVVQKNFQDIADTAEDTGKKVRAAVKGSSNAVNDLTEDVTQASNAIEKLGSAASEFNSETERMKDSDKDHHLNSDLEAMRDHAMFEDKRKSLLDGNKSYKELNGINAFFDKILDAFNVGSYNVRKAFYTFGDIIYGGYTFIASVFKTIFSGLAFIASRFIEAIYNPIAAMSLTLDALRVGWIITIAGIVIGIVKVVKLVFDYVAMIPKLVESLQMAAAGVMFSGVSKMLLSLSVFMISLAAFISVLGVVSQYCDMADIRKIVDELKDLAGWIAIILGIIAIISIVIAHASIMKSVSRLFNAPKSIVKALGNGLSTLIELFLSVGVILGVLMFLGKWIEKDGDAAVEAMHRALAIMANVMVVMILFAAMMTMFSKALGDMSTGGGVSLGWNKGLKASIDGTVSPMTQMTLFLLALIPVMLAMAATLKILNGIPVEDMLMETLAIVTIFTFMSVVMGVVLDGIQGILKNGGNIKVLTQAKGIISAVSTMLISIAGSLALLTYVQTLSGDPNALRYSVGAMLVTLLFVLLGMGTLVYYVSKMKITPQRLSKISGLFISISLVLITIAASLALLSFIQIKGGDLLNPLLSMLAVMGVVTIMLASVLAIISVNSKGMTPDRLKAVAQIFVSIGGFIFLAGLAIGAMGAVAGMFGWQTIAVAAAAMIATLITITMTIAGLLAIIKACKITTPEMLSLTAIIESMSLLLLSIAGALFILNTIDWSGFKGSEKYLVGTIVFIMLLSTVFIILSVVGRSIGSSIVAIAGIASILLAIAVMFKIMASIDWSGMDNAFKFLIAIEVFITLLAGAIVAITAIAAAAPMADVALALVMGIILSMAVVIAAVGLVIYLFGNAALKIGEAISNIIESFALIQDLDFESVASCLLGLMGLILEIILIGGIMPLAMIAIAIMGLGFKLLASGLATMSLISPEQVTSATEGIKQLMSSLAEIFSEENMQHINDGMSIGFGLSLLAIVIGVAIVALAAGITIGAALLLVSAILLVGVGAVILLAGDIIQQGLTKLADIFIEFAAYMDENLGKVMIGMGELMLLGILLTVTGASLLIGSALMVVGAALFLVAAVGLSTGVEILVDTLTNGDIEKIMANTLKLVLLSALLTVSGTAMLGGSISFLLGSSMLLAGSTIFQKATAKISEATEDLTNAANNMEAVGEFITEGLVLGIENGAPLVEQAMWNLGWSSCFGTFCNALGIASPSQRLRESGHYIIAGLVEGIEDKTPGLADFIADVGEMIPATMNDSIDMEPVSNNIINGGIEGGGGFFNSISSIIGDGSGTLINGLGDLGSLMGSAMGNNMIDQFANAYDTIVSTFNHVSKGPDMANMSDSAAFAAYRGTSAAIDSGALEPVQTSFDGIDLGEIIDIDDLLKDVGSGGGGGGGSYTPVYGGEDVDYGIGGSGGGAGGRSTPTDDLISSISSNSGAGTGINDLSQGGTNINSNNTYNFTQNNYSPKELDRTELYEQTNYQLKRWYGWMQSNA